MNRLNTSGIIDIIQDLSKYTEYLDVLNLMIALNLYHMIRFNKNDILSFYITTVETYSINIVHLQHGFHSRGKFILHNLDSANTTKELNLTLTSDKDLFYSYCYHWSLKSITTYNFNKLTYYSDLVN